jgi:hypothetical protein
MVPFHPCPPIRRITLEGIILGKKIGEKQAREEEKYFFHKQ